MGAFEDFVNLELPRRATVFTEAILGVTGDPNTGISATLDAAPVGTFFHDSLLNRLWTKTTPSATGWVNLSTQTGAAIDLYVRDVDGDDTNDGLTTGTPLQTIQAAIDRVPFQNNHRVTIHVGDHSGSGYPFPRFGVRSYGDDFFVVGDGGGTGDGFTETLAEEASTTGTDETKVVSSTGGHTVDEFVGHTVVFTSGACNGYRRMVHSNTATDILFVTDTDINGNSPSSGDTFKIVRPSVVINAGSGLSTSTILKSAGGSARGFTSVDTSLPGGSLVLAQLNITSAIQMGLSFDDVETCLLGVEMDNTSGSRFDLHFGNCAAFFGTDNSVGHSTKVATALGAPDNAAWTGYGVYRVDSGSPSQGSPLSSAGRPRATISGFIVSNKGLECYDNNCTILGGRVDEGIIARGPSEFRVQGTFFTSNPIRIHATGTNDCLEFSEMSRGSAVNIDFDAVDGHYIHTRGNSWVQEFGCTGAGPTGTGNTVFAAEGGKSFHFVTPAMGDAAADDFVVEGVPGGLNKADFAAAGDGISGVSGSSISRG